MGHPGDSVRTLGARARRVRPAQVLELLADFEVDGVANDFFLFNLDGRLRFTTPAPRRRGLVAAGLSGIIAGATDSRDALVIAADGSVTSRLHVAATGPEPASMLM